MPLAEALDVLGSTHQKKKVSLAEFKMETDALERSIFNINQDTVFLVK